jgi:hypothetical protein
VEVGWKENELEDLGGSGSGFVFPKENPVDDCWA